MTLQQEACEKIMKLPEDGIKLIIVMADEIARQHGISTEMNTAEKNRFMTRRKKAFHNMLEMREHSSYPKDFDYKKVIEEAVNEKYSIID